MAHGSIQSSKSTRPNQIVFQFLMWLLTISEMNKKSLDLKLDRSAFINFSLILCFVFSSFFFLFFSSSSKIRERVIYVLTYFLNLGYSIHLGQTVDQYCFAFS